MIKILCILIHVLFKINNLERISINIFITDKNFFQGPLLWGLCYTYY